MASVDALRLGRLRDGRRKLTSEQENDIKRRHLLGEPIRAIARLYPHVTRRAIQFFLFPERKKGRLVTWRDYYSTEQHKKDMQKHRAKKRLLLTM